jgi:prepilin-type N-terminal cleavage/methylation domain-containing protein
VADSRQQRRRGGGFTLLEMMICIAILAVAVFPLLLIKEESQLAATDAKMRRIARNSIQNILSKAMIELYPGDTMRGDLADEGYPNIQYELECEDLDLSTEISSADESTTAGDSIFKTAAEEKKEKEDKERRERSAFDDPAANIDARFLCRHVKITITYTMGSGDNPEKGEIKTETYLNPLPPKKDFSKLPTPSDKVAPNTKK